MVIRHLLPRALSTTVTNLNRLWVAIENAVIRDTKLAADFKWLDMFPATTSMSSQWAAQFGYTRNTHGDAIRTQLAAVWQGLSFEALGFPGVTVTTRPSVDPLSLLHASSNHAPGGGKGLVLVNKLLQNSPILSCLAGEPWMSAGEPKAEAGEFDGYSWSREEYVVVEQMDRYFVYVEGPALPLSQKELFEDVCLRLLPAHCWIGILVEYT